MNWCMLLVAAQISCPWTPSSCRTYYYAQPMPVYVTCQPVPTCTYPSTMVCGPVVAEVVEETTQAVAAKEEVEEEDPLVAAAATEEEDPDDNLEFVDFSSPAPYAGGDLGLGYGVSSIGAGTLYPNPQYLSGGGGFFPYGTGTNNGSPSFVTPAGGTTIINNIINNTPPAFVPQPVPEPASAAAWLLAGAGLVYLVRRRSRMAQSA